MQFSLPARDNKKLARLLEIIGEDQELRQLWKCANINAIDRGGLSDRWSKGSHPQKSLY